VTESPDRRLVAIGFLSGAVIVFDAVSGAHLAAVDATGVVPERLTFNADGSLTIEGSGGRIDHQIVSAG
jgi:hypothetical protein